MFYSMFLHYILLNIFFYMFYNMYFCIVNLNNSLWLMIIEMRVV